VGEISVAYSDFQSSSGVGEVRLPPRLYERMSSSDVVNYNTDHNASAFF